MQIKTKIFSCHTGDSKPVKQEVSGTVILPPLVFPAQGHNVYMGMCKRERERERVMKNKVFKRKRKKRVT